MENKNIADMKIPTTVSLQLEIDYYSNLLAKHEQLQRQTLSAEQGCSRDVLPPNPSSASCISKKTFSKNSYISMNSQISNNPFSTNVSHKRTVILNETKFPPIDICKALVPNSSTEHSTLLNEQAMKPTVNYYKTKTAINRNVFNRGKTIPKKMSNASNLILHSGKQNPLKGNGKVYFKKAAAVVFDNKYKYTKKKVTDRPLVSTEITSIERKNVKHQKLINEIVDLTKQLKQNYNKNRISGIKSENLSSVSKSSSKISAVKLTLPEVATDTSLKSESMVAKESKNINVLQKIGLDHPLDDKAKLHKELGLIYPSLKEKTQVLLSSQSSTVILDNLPTEESKPNILSSFNKSKNVNKPTVKNEQVDSQVKNEKPEQVFEMSTHTACSTPKAVSTHCRSLKKPTASSIKKPKVTKLVSSKYSVINRRTPGTSFSNNSVSKISPSKLSSLSKNSKKVTHLSSKYKIVNKRQSTHKKNTSKITPFKSSRKSKTAFGKISSAYTLVNKKSTISSSKNVPELKNVSANAKKLSYFSNSMKNKSLSNSKSYQDSATPSRKILVTKSKYKIVKKSSSSFKKINKKRRISLSKLRELCHHHTDIDLIMEMADCKNLSFLESSGVASPNMKNMLTRRIFKSKNALINKNCQSVQSRTAKMIKTKYFTPNRKSLHYRKSPKYGNLKRFNGHSRDSSFYKPHMSKSHNRIKRENFTRFKINKYVNSTSRMKSFHSRTYELKKRFVKSNYAIGNKAFKRPVYQNHVQQNFSQKSFLPVTQAIASRVLNKSISRALSASAKKMTKVNTYCMFYNRFGRCNKGDKCSYVHDPSKIAVCTRFLRGTCKVEKCPFSHEVCPGKMALCSFFLLGACTQQRCPYRHEALPPDARMCKPFLQGYCAQGRKCKKAHILVCPQYIQGLCLKGDACEFPHPIQREKKKTKTMESCGIKEERESKETGDRYFLPSDETIESETVVPRRRRNLPEQPSFLSLSLTESEKS